MLHALQIHSPLYSKRIVPCIRICLAQFMQTGRLFLRFASPFHFLIVAIRAVVKSAATFVTFTLLLVSPLCFCYVSLRFVTKFSPSKEILSSIRVLSWSFLRYVVLNDLAHFRDMIKRSLLRCRYCGANKLAVLLLYLSLSMMFVRLSLGICSITFG